MNTSVLLLGLVLLASYLDETIAFGIAHHTAPPPQPGVVSTATPFQHYSLQNRPTSGSNTAKDYIYLWLLAPDTRMNVQEQRQEQQQQQPLQVASQAQVKQALQNPKTVLLDARTDEEIIQQGFLSVKGHRWVHASCTKDDCPLLLKTAESQLPDKDIPVITYCGTGLRGAQAAKTLQNKGYKQVLNAGAYPDLDYLKATSS